MNGLAAANSEGQWLEEEEGRLRPRHGETAEGGFCPGRTDVSKAGVAPLGRDLQLLRCFPSPWSPGPALSKDSANRAVWPTHLAQVQDEAVPGVEAVPAQRPLGGANILLPLHLVQLPDGLWGGLFGDLVKC